MGLIMGGACWMLLFVWVWTTFSLSWASLAQPYRDFCNAALCSSPVFISCHGCTLGFRVTVFWFCDGWQLSLSLIWRLLSIKAASCWTNLYFLLCVCVRARAPARLWRGKEWCVVCVCHDAYACTVQQNRSVSAMQWHTPTEASWAWACTQRSAQIACL